MRKILSLSMIVIWVGICMSGYAEEGIPANLEYSVYELKSFANLCKRTMEVIKILPTKQGIIWAVSNSIV